MTSGEEEAVAVEEVDAKRLAATVTLRGEICFNGENSVSSRYRN